MPKPLQYKAGSLIFARGEDAIKIFILQKGRITLVYEDIGTGGDVREQVLPGEFFGVKSALGRFPREENAIARTDSTVLTFTVPEFELLTMSDTRIMVKLLKVFSKQMRRIHTHIVNLLGPDPARQDEALFNLGEKFINLKRFAHAKYVFGRYLDLYPDGEDADQAQKNIHLADVSLVCAEQNKTAEAADKAPAADKTEGAADKAPAAGTEEPELPVAFARFAKVFHSDEIFFCEHEPGKNFYLIQSGKVKLVKNTGDVERTLDILQAPDMFGEMALLEDSPRTATAIAIDEVTALEFNMQNFTILLHGNPQIAFRLLRIFSKRIYDSKRRFVILTLPDLPSKIAYVFLILDETQTDIDKSESSREFFTTIEDIAQWAGVSVQQAKDTLSHFISQNRIEIYSDRIVVKNINDMSRLVNSRLRQM